MTLAIKHNFVTSKSDGTDASVLRPSNWNEPHVITMATANLVGRATAGNGAAEEIPCSAAAMAMLAQTDIASILSYLGVSVATTGVGRFTLQTAAAPGWVLMNDGTLGDASSGASTRANADCSALFQLVYANVSDANAPLFTNTGAATLRAVQGSAANAWAAHCRVAMPKQLGRAMAAAGNGAGLSARALGSSAGAETVTLGTPNLPPYTPTGVVGAGTITIGTGGINVTNGGTGTYDPRVGAPTTTIPTSGGAFAGDAQGGVSTPFGITQPSTYWNVEVKL